MPHNTYTRIGGHWPVGSRRNNKEEAGLPNHYRFNAKAEDGSTADVSSCSSEIKSNAGFSKPPSLIPRKKAAQDSRKQHLQRKKKIRKSLGKWSD